MFKLVKLHVFINRLCADLSFLVVKEITRVTYNVHFYIELPRAFRCVKCALIEIMAKSQNEDIKIKCFYLSCK